MKTILDCCIFQLLRGDPVIMNEFDRSSTGCQLKRIHRQADNVYSFSNFQ